MVSKPPSSSIGATHGHRERQPGGRPLQPIAALASGPTTTTSDT